MTPSSSARDLARRLSALPESVMREQVLLEYLLTTDPGEAVPVLAEVHALGSRGGPPFNLALLAFVGVLGRELLSYERRASLYAVAKEAGLLSLLPLFLSPREEQAAVAERGHPDRDLTLGHRKTMARSRDRDQLLRLMRDPEPEVIPLVLRNPRLTERDVVALAARRPTTAELQHCVFESRRWIVRYAVKRTLVLNPCTPTDLGLRLLGFLSTPDLREVCSSSSLALTLREAARRLLDDARPGM
jgi:hypothetical protein